MADAPPLRCAVIGAGRMGMVHGHLLQVYPATELVGFADPQPGARARLASQGVRAPVFAGIAELLATAQPEAVFVCTPTHTHLAVTRECLARPVHLFMEKPVATSVADADAILALARERGVVHAAGYVYAHLPIVEEARRLLAEGVLGEILRFSAHAYISEVFGPKSGWFFQRELSGGGVVANMGSHVLFILGWMFGRIRRVMATTRSHASNVEDSAQALLWFDRGVTGMLDTSWSMPGAQMLDYGITIDGRQGTLVLGREHILLHLLRAARDHPEGWSEIHASDLPADTAFDISPHIGGEAFYRQLRVFETACRTGRLPFCSLDEAANTQRMIEGIYSSATSGQPVEVS
jgi:predicted dehydrogenase